MDPILQVLFSWQFVLFSLAVATVVYVFRVIIEYIISSWFKIDPKKPQWWNDLILPIAPVVTGVLGGMFFKSFPYPNGLTTQGDRIVFGLVAGLLSTLVYRVFKSLLYQKIQGIVQLLPGAVPYKPNIYISSYNSYNQHYDPNVVSTPTGTPVKASSPNLPARGQM
jgi:hypothetical protein